VEGLPVEFIAWPADAARREALSRAAIPRVLLVAPDVEVPGMDAAEDWIRLPATEADVLARATQLLRILAHLRSDVPFIDGERVLHRAGMTVVLTPREAAILSTLLGNPGNLVGHDELAARGWSGGVPTRDAMDAAIYRLRRRVEGLQLHIGAVRGRGYVLSF
jgi:DNA-binding response OmpR family regulator